jgi:hypothetical protein
MSAGGRADMARIKSIPLSKLNWRNAPGPGDLWGSPPDDPPLALCEDCGDEFEFDPKDYEDADEDGVYCTPPEKCEDCQDKADQFEAINQYIDATAQAEAVQFIIEQGLGWDFAEDLKAEAEAEKKAAEKAEASEQ